MRKGLIVLVMLMTCTWASAQITWNVKAGAGVAWIGNLDKKFGWKAGVGIEKPFSTNWLIMPTLELKQKGCTYEGLDATLLYAQLPIMAAYRTRLSKSVNMTFKAGPYLAYGFSGNVSADGYDDYDFFDVEGERFDYGLMLGVDFEYHRMVFGMEWEQGLANVFASDEVSAENAAAYITIGYKF